MFYLVSMRSPDATGAGAGLLGALGAGLLASLGLSALGAYCAGEGAEGACSFFSSAFGAPD